MARCSCDTRDGWVVVRREWACSAFDGYHGRPSDYSDVRCATCGVVWRTNAGYVTDLPDDPQEARRSERDRTRVVERGGGQGPLRVAYAPPRGPSKCEDCEREGGPLLGPLTSRDGRIVHRDGCRR